MKVTKATITDNTLAITLDGSNNVSKIYLDTVCNYNNIHSDSDEDHSHVITEGLGNNSSFSIDISAIKDKAYIVTVISTEKAIALAIDDKQLYYDKVHMITNFCNTCMDKCQKEKIIMVELRSNLLDYALANDLTEDAIKHYVDLDRILNDSVNNNICCS